MRGIKKKKLKETREKLITLRGNDVEKFLKRAIYSRKVLQLRDWYFLRVIWESVFWTSFPTKKILLFVFVVWFFYSSKMVTPLKSDFSPLFRKILLFPQKLFNKKIIETLFPIRKVVFIFIASHHSCTKETSPPETIFAENSAFFRKHN